VSARGSMRRRAPERAALLGVVVNAALAVGKLAAGILGHSFALVADAAESIVDIVGSLVIWGALRYGGRPPDENHPFGHGKIEALAALSIGALILATGLGLGWQSILNLGTPQRTPAAFTLVVLVAVVAVKEGMYRLASRAARRGASDAGRVDAFHHRADAITSLFALVGISLALLGGPAWAVADDWAALAASAVIAINGVRLSRGPFDELLDTHAPEIADAATAAALAVEGILGVERCEARRSGRGYRVVMHAEVDPTMSVADAHRLTGRIKQRARADEPRIDSVLVHIEPFDPA
jgi:cation diffusion facilitator family transporter